MFTEVMGSAPTIVRAAACIPINDIFTTPLSQAFNLLVGGVGAIAIKWLVLIAFIVLLVRVLVNVIRARRAHEDISALAVVVIVVVAVILAIVLVNTVFAALNNMC